MSDQPEDAERNESLEDYGNRLNNRGLYALVDMWDREKTYTNIRVLDVKLGRNFRNLVRGTISKRMRDSLPPTMISYLNDVSAEELIQFLRTWTQEQWFNTTTYPFNTYFASARKSIDSKNKAIISYQQWDVNDYHECFEDILKDVFYLYANHGEMFVRALTEFVKQLCTVFCTNRAFAEKHPARNTSSDKHCCGTEKKEKSPYDAEKLFFHCLNCILEYQTQDYCSYALRVLAPWLDGAKKALDKSNADLHPYGRKHIRNQQKLRMAGSKIEKDENGLFVLKKCVAEDEKSSMELSGVKNHSSKAQKRKSEIEHDVKKYKKQVVASTNNEVASAFHRFTPFPNNGGFTHYTMCIQKPITKQ